MCNVGMLIFTYKEKQILYIYIIDETSHTDTYNIFDITICINVCMVYIILYLHNIVMYITILYYIMHTIIYIIYHHG